MASSDVTIARESGAFGKMGRMRVVGESGPETHVLSIKYEASELAFGFVMSPFTSLPLMRNTSEPSRFGA